MNKELIQNQSDIQIQIAKCILKGMTISQIAKKMCCSHSAVSYQINILYSKYNSKSRNDFILRVFSEIIDNYKKQIEQKNERIRALESDMEEVRNILFLLSTNRNNPGVFDYWAQEGKKYII